MLIHRLDIITCLWLKRLLIKVASHHVKNKADVFKKGIMQTVLEEFYDDNYPKPLADKMAFCFLFFGIHCRLERLETQLNDFNLCDSEEADA